MTTQLLIPRSITEEMVAHAREEAPNECCGVLTGSDGAVSAAYRAKNVDRSPVKYTIDPVDTLRIFGEADRVGVEVLAFYHSHTFSEAYPSPTDVKLAPPPELFDYQHVIVSLANAEEPVIRCFAIDGCTITETVVEIVD